MILNILFQKNYNENVRRASLNDECCTNEEGIVQIKKENNCENELQLKSTNDEFKNAIQTIRKKEQIICAQSRIIKNLNAKMRKYKKCLLIVRRDLKAKKKQNNR